jgi:hypothetical protein
VADRIGSDSAREGTRSLDPFAVERSVDPAFWHPRSTLPCQTHRAERWERRMTNQASEDQDLEAPMRAATEALRETVLRLLRAGEVHPQLIVLAMARMTGELAAAAALAGGQEFEPLLGKLAEVVRHAGREHQETLQAEGLPVASNA